MNVALRAGVFRGAVAAVVALGVSGCGGGTNGSTSRQIAALRVVDASPDAGGLDVYANSTALTYNVGFGTVSSYIAFTPGTYTLESVVRFAPGLILSVVG